MMKHTLESILTFGRTLLDAPPTVIGSNKVSLEVDYKVLLLSNYVSKRIREISGRSLEISFMYGGSVVREVGETKIKLDSFYVSPKQKISGSAFDGTAESTYDANQHFSRQNKRIVAIGHSHADYDVFHSGDDYSNYENLVGSVGIKIEQLAENKIDASKTYVSISHRLKRFFSVKKAVSASSSFSYILPSLVFNENNKCVDSVIASKSYFDVDGQVKTNFKVQDCHLYVYNKQAVINDDEKRYLDFSIRKVLSYNCIK